MERNKLSSYLGDIFVYVLYLIGVVILGMLIYNLINLDTSGIYASLFFLLFYILIFGRKIVRFKKVYFDKKYIYINKFGKIDFQKIIRIESKKIEFLHKEKEQLVYFNYFFPSKNYSILRKYIEEATLG